jgi:thiopeptide-type bacteriocin biosynthesis protein
MRFEDWWVSSYLYYNGPLEHIILDVVYPFIEKMKRNPDIKGYFFIRYWENGQHIRLRIKCNSVEAKNRIKRRIIDLFEKFLLGKRTDESVHDDSFQSGSVHFIDYIPEIDRYGGTSAIMVAEKQFELSSKVVLELLRKTDGLTYNSAMGIALKLHVSFAFAVGMSVDEAVEFYSTMSENWKPDLLGRQTSTDEYYLWINKKFTESFEKQKDVIVPIVENLWYTNSRHGTWLEEWHKGMKAISAELQILYGQNEVNFPSPSIFVQSDLTAENNCLWNIYISYVHMTNNRLGINNYDEGYLCFIIKESLVSIHDKY